MASSSSHSESDKGKGKASASDLPPQTPQFSPFPMQEISHTDGRVSLSKDKDEWEAANFEIDKDEADNYSVEKFMVDGKHFSHHHPLTSCDEDKQVDEIEDNKGYLCKLCGLPILSSPSYTCTHIGCNFFLHKPCALSFPPKLIHSAHIGSYFDNKHTLYMVKQSSSPNCTFKCDRCYIQLHPLVAVGGVEIKIKHKSHPSHPLMAMGKEISCECDACGEKHDGFFFSCQVCNFWIHQNCTILPNYITLPNHPMPFILAYSLPLFQIGDPCIICRKQVLFRHNGVYICPQTNKFAHVPCGANKFASKTTLKLIQMPDDEWDAFPTSVIRTYAQSNLIDPPASYANVFDDELTIEKYHNHPLIPIQLTTTTSKKACNLACDFCTRPINISSLVYKCDHCHFVAHKICADILPILKFFIPGVNIWAEHCGDLSSHFFNSIFSCRLCYRPCNGLCYYLPKISTYKKRGPICIDIECMAAPSTVKHASHPQHLLVRTSRLMSKTPLTCCLDDSFIYDVYRCITCEYFIHIRCAMFPKRITYHEYHHHPLYLVFTTHDDETNCFCEVCEKDIDLKYWMYRCGECEQSFHINCIPSVGHLSKVKFGGTVNLPDNHIHPLILTRMLTLPSQRCRYCNQIIQGLVDEIAFFCSLCHFWLHFSCARNSEARKTSNALRLYSYFEDKDLLHLWKIQLFGEW